MISIKLCLSKYCLHEYHSVVSNHKWHSISLSSSVFNNWTPEIYGNVFLFSFEESSMLNLWVLAFNVSSILCSLFVKINWHCNLQDRRYPSFLVSHNFLKYTYWSGLTFTNQFRLDERSSRIVPHCLSDKYGPQLNCFLNRFREQMRCFNA